MDRWQIIAIIIGLLILFLCTAGCEQKPIERLALRKIGPNMMSPVEKILLAALPPDWTNNPEVIVIYPISTMGHVSPSPFYFHTKEGKGSWTPLNGDAGVYQVKFSATDGVNIQDEVVTITVNEVNYPPYIIAKFTKKEVPKIY